MRTGQMNYILAPIDGSAGLGEGSDYARAALALAEESMDLALVDGAYRDHTAKSALPKIKPGGLLIIDNDGGESATMHEMTVRCRIAP